MSFTRRTYEVLQRFKDLGKLKRLRTFIALRLYSSPWAAYCYLSKNVLHEALFKLRRLRVLSLSGYCITELPNSIGDLKQLRYLNFSQTKIKRLPESVSTLINLQTLKLYGYRKLNKLPQGTGNLINLCHLDITDTDNLLEMPPWMGSFTGLQKLSQFIVGKKEGCGIEELKGLQNLEGRLSIMALHNVIDARHAGHANLRGKHNLDELELEWFTKCDEVTPKCMFHNSSLITLKLGSMSRLTCLKGQFLRSLGLKVLMISDFPELTSLWQKGTGLENFEHPQSLLTEIGMPSTHKSSKLSGCGKLDLLPIQRVPMLLSLDVLCIESCPDLVSIPEAGLLSSLRYLVLRDCKALRSLPETSTSTSMQWSSGLDEAIHQCLIVSTLRLSNTDHFAVYMEENSTNEQGSSHGLATLAVEKQVGIPDLGALFSFWLARIIQLNPTELNHDQINKKEIWYDQCERRVVGESALGSLPDGISSCPLECLEIEECPSLKCFPGGMLPPTLKGLKIRYCTELKSLPEGLMHNKNGSGTLFKHLSELNLSNCSALKLFPGDGFSLPNLRTLTIYNCKNLKSLPIGMRKLTSLQELTICSCPALKAFPNGDMPPNLTSLEIWDCDRLDGCLSEWNLQSLAFLRDFSIAGGCFSDTVSFPDEKWLLPTTLTSVWIGRLPNLESLSMQLQSLAYLEELEIVDCPKLKSLPRGCLPHALGRFSIRDCPLMTQRCSKEKGVYWPLISHIPCVEIDDGNDM
ncbi:disease resistance RPP13-like protein 1 [Populus alba x Populus x berolinensis]|nr:disease resistance RPP13-like protein 1 [Populus alba x Populus x berolinensis]